jgi:hypothetical protein
MSQRWGGAHRQAKSMSSAIAHAVVVSPVMSALPCYATMRPCPCLEQGPSAATVTLQAEAHARVPEILKLHANMHSP